MRQIEFQIWSSESDSSHRFFKGYQPGDPMRMTFEGELATVAPSKDVLEDLFRKFNEDDRPNAGVAHSLSVGDVVVLNQLDSLESEAWAVRPLGFERVEFDVLSFSVPARHQFLCELVEKINEWLGMEHDAAAEVAAKHADGSVDVEISGHDDPDCKPYQVVLAWVGVCKDGAGKPHNMVELREEQLLLMNAVPSLIGSAMLEV